MTDTAKELAVTLTAVLGVPVSAGDAFVFKECPAWDSMKHIEIIMAVEETFGVSFETGDIPKMISQQVLLHAIENMLAR